MRIWMIPRKGKGHEVTARNLAPEPPVELSRPLTTDPWDNAILYEKQTPDADYRNGL